MKILLGAFVVIGLFLFGGLIIIGLFLVQFAYEARPLRKKEPGFPYIYVNDNGSTQELNEEEQEYLNTNFRGDDGARPYIKSNYEKRTPDGRLSGFLLRRQLPENILIYPAVPPKKPFSLSYRD